MAIRKLILGRNNDQTNLVFNKQINVVEDIDLSKELGTENIKNEDSTLIIKSMNDTQISDVIQLKINLTSVGTFLANFDKETLKEEDRKAMFDSLKSLKDEVEPTEKTQTKKVLKILSILNFYRPIYVTFLNKKEIKIDINEVGKKLTWSFPLLVLAIPPKKKSIFERLSGNKTKKEKYITEDHFFVSIFSILLSFTAVTGTNEFIIKENVSIFLTILSAIFAAILFFVCFKLSSKQKIKKLPFTITIFSLIGWILGSTGAVFASKYLLTKEDKIFDLKNLLIYGGGISLVVVILVILISNLIGKKKSKNKKTN